MAATPSDVAAQILTLAGKLDPEFARELSVSERYAVIDGERREYHAAETRYGQAVTALVTSDPTEAQIVAVLAGARADWERRARERESAALDRPMPAMPGTKVIAPVPRTSDRKAQPRGQWLPTGIDPGYAPIGALPDVSVLDRYRALAIVVHRAIREDRAADHAERNPPRERGAVTHVNRHPTGTACARTGRGKRGRSRRQRR